MAQQRTQIAGVRQQLEPAIPECFRAVENFSLCFLGSFQFIRS